jgi:hypothetical protein
MNLIKAQALANDLPIPELQKYANGFDPRIIPPWIATGTLQSKTDAKKRIDNMMGGTQGETPSVKEQIEQKAGLMAAQAMQQQQAQQQMAQRPQPGPAPANIPQPEAQPEEAMMARGGLAKVPMQFSFKPGGIVGYATGGDTMGMGGPEEQELASRASEMASNERNRAKIIEELERKVEFLTRAEAPQAAAVRAQLEAFKSSGATSLPQKAQAPMATSQGPADRIVPRRSPEQNARPAPPPQAPPRARQAMPQQAAPQAAPTGLPAAAQRSPYFAQAESSVNAPIKAPTPQDIIAEQTALSPAVMQEAAMQKRNEERRARADQERQSYEASKPSGLDDLIRVFGQAGQYKGMTGLAPAYTANQQEKRAAEAAMLKRQNEMLNAADTQEYEGAKDLYGARAGSMKQANQSYQDRLKSRSETLAQLAGVDQRRIDAELGRLNDMQLQRMRMAQSAAEAGRPGEGERVVAKYLAMRAAGDIKGAEAYMDAIQRVKRGEQKPDPLESAMAKQYAEQYGAALQLPEGDLKNQRLAALKTMEQRIAGGGGGSFTVTAGGKTYTFPSQEAANKFKAEAGVK